MCVVFYLVYPVVQVSVDSRFLIAPFVFSNIYLLHYKHFWSNEWYSYVTDDSQMLNSCFRIVNMKCRLSQKVAEINCVFEVQTSLLILISQVKHIFINNKKNFNSTINVSLLSKKFWPHEHCQYVRIMLVFLIRWIIYIFV